MITVYGISNCDSVKKARAWLDENALGYSFHDFKKQGLPEPQLRRWEQAVGWEKLLNRKGTTWRKLDPALQTATADSASALALMQANASVIKRPVLDWNGEISVGFDASDWAARL